MDGVVLIAAHPKSEMSESCALAMFGTCGKPTLPTAAMSQKQTLGRDPLVPPRAGVDHRPRSLTWREPTSETEFK